MAGSQTQDGDGPATVPEAETDEEWLTRQTLMDIQESRRQVEKSLQAYRAARGDVSGRNKYRSAHMAYTNLCAYITQVEPIMRALGRSDLLNEENLGVQQVVVTDDNGEPLAGETYQFEGLTTLLQVSHPFQVTAEVEKRVFGGRSREEETEVEPIGLEVLEYSFRLINQFLQEQGLYLPAEETRESMNV